jgi:zinc protease
MTAMLTKGTKNRTREEIARLIESVGGQLEPTSGRNTFMLSISVLKEHLPLAIDLLSDMLLNPSFDEKEFDTVKKMALFGLKREQENPFMANMREVHKALYGSHPYAMLPNGTYESVSSLTRQDVARFHETYCRPGSMVLAVVGDVNQQELVGNLEEAFKGFADAPVPSLAFPAIPDQKEALRKELHGTQPALGVGSLAFRTVAMKDKDRYAFDVLDSMLGSMGGRIFVNLRDRDALAYELGCTSRVQLDRGFFWFYVRTSPENIEKFFAGVRRELDSLANEEIPADELERAKNSVIGAFIAEQQTNRSQAMSYALDTIYDVGEHDIAHYPEHISAISTDDIKRIVKTYLVPESAVFVVTQPAAKKEKD